MDKIKIGYIFTAIICFIVSVHVVYVMIDESGCVNQLNEPSKIYEKRITEKPMTFHSEIGPESIITVPPTKVIELDISKSTESIKKNEDKAKGQQETNSGNIPLHKGIDSVNNTELEMNSTKSIKIRLGDRCWYPEQIEECQAITPNTSCNYGYCECKKDFTLTTNLTCEYVGIKIGDRCFSPEKVKECLTITPNTSCEDGYCDCKSNFTLTTNLTCEYVGPWWISKWPWSKEHPAPVWLRDDWE